MLTMRFRSVTSFERSRRDLTSREHGRAEGEDSRTRLRQMSHRPRRRLVRLIHSTSTWLAMIKSLSEVVKSDQGAMVMLVMKAASAINAKKQNYTPVMKGDGQLI